MDYTLYLSSGLAGCCKRAHEGFGLPSSEVNGVLRPWLLDSLVRMIDAIARELQREDVLRAMNDGNLDQTLIDVSRVDRGGPFRAVSYAYVCTVTRQP